MEHVNAARVLMGDSLGFHIIFAMLGVGLPLVFLLIELWAIRRNDKHMREIARRISQLAGLLVVVGVVTGTLIAVQLSLMWPGLVTFGHKVIGLPFMLEGYAFIFEALFLGYYLYTWDKLTGYKHLIAGLPVLLGAMLSAVMITSVDAWMNRPEGFQMIDGKMVVANPWDGILTPTTMFMTTHSIASYYLIATLITLAGIIWYQRKAQLSGLKQKSTAIVARRLAVVALVCFAIVGLVGHFQVQFLRWAQPTKYAAIEQVPRTTSDAPYVFGGTLNESTMTVEGGIVVPHLLSILTGNSSDTEVPGLADTPRRDWPLLIVHDLFEYKLILIVFVAIVIVGYLAVQKYLPRIAVSRMMAMIMTGGAIVSVIIMELGWMLTELGRQPYAVHGYLRTADAFSKNPQALAWGYVFPMLFVLLSVVTVIALRRMIKGFSGGQK